MSESLNRLLSQNYIGRTGDVYNFLTDEEQDIQREIKSTPVDTSAIVERIAQMIYGDIYTTRKFRYGRYDFDFDKMVDGVTSGAVTGGMKLRFLTVATDAVEKTDLRLSSESVKQAIVVLSETSYYESIESAMRFASMSSSGMSHSFPSLCRISSGTGRMRPTPMIPAQWII